MVHVGTSAWCSISSSNLKQASLPVSSAGLQRLWTGTGTQQIPPKCSSNSDWSWLPSESRCSSHTSWGRIVWICPVVQQQYLLCYAMEVCHPWYRLLLPACYGQGPVIGHTCTHKGRNLHTCIIILWPTLFCRNQCKKKHNKIDKKTSILSQPSNSLHFPDFVSF